MMWIQNIWISAICVPYFILLREKPEHAPSLSSMEESRQPNFCLEIRDALRLPQYVKLVVCFALMQGSFIAFGTNINQLFAPVGFTNL